MQLNKLKFLQIGLGSMGKRRIRNLLFHNVRKEQISGFDLSRKRCSEIKKEFKIEVASDFNEAVKKNNPDVFIISTPPNKHHDYFLYAAQRKKHFFVEVPTTNKGYDKLLPLLDDSFVAAPSCTFRYVPGVIYLKDILDRGVIGKPLTFNHYLGQYLPDWHPYEDYRKVYFAQRETGGAREMFIHELVWLVYLFGSPIKRSIGYFDKISDLEMTAEDIYTSIVQLKNKVVGNIMVDLLNRKAFRNLRIIGTEGTIDWDWLKYEIKIYFSKGENDKTIKLSQVKKLAHYNTTEDIYRAEMKDFLDAVCGSKKFPYSFKEDSTIMDVFYKIKKTHKKYFK